MMTEAIKIEKSLEVNISKESYHCDKVTLQEMLAMNKVCLKNGNNQMNSFFQDINKEIQKFSNLLTHSASFVILKDNTSTAAVFPTVLPPYHSHLSKPKCPASSFHAIQKISSPYMNFCPRRPYT